MKNKILCLLTTVIILSTGTTMVSAGDNDFDLPAINLDETTTNRVELTTNQLETTVPVTSEQTESTSQDSSDFQTPTIPYEDQTSRNLETTNNSESVKTTTVATNPGKILKISVKNLKKRAIRLSFSKAKNAKKYKIQYTTNRKFKGSVKTRTTVKLTYTINSLKSGKTYYVRVCGINGKKQGAWSKIKKIKIKNTLK